MMIGSPGGRLGGLGSGPGMASWKPSSVRAISPPDLGCIDSPAKLERYIHLQSRAIFVENGLPGPGSPAPSGAAKSSRSQEIKSQPGLNQPLALSLPLDRERLHQLCQLQVPATTHDPFDNVRREQGEAQDASHV
jgi:hypothetical protein